MTVNDVYTFLEQHIYTECFLQRGIIILTYTIKDSTTCLNTISIDVCCAQGLTVKKMFPQSFCFPE